MEEAKRPLQPEQELVRKLEVGARLTPQGVAVPYGRMVTTDWLWRLTQSGPYEILEWPAQAPPPRAEPAAHQVVPSRVARCPTVQQIPNPTPGPFPGASDCQGSGHWIVFLLAGFNPTGLFPVRLSEVTGVQRWVQNSCIPQESRGKGEYDGLMSPRAAPWWKMLVKKPNCASAKIMTIWNKCCRWVTRAFRHQSLTSNKKALINECFGAWIVTVR